MMIYSLGRVEGKVNVKVDTRKFFTFIDVRILSSSSSPASALRRREDRFVSKRRELKKPSEIFEGWEKGDRRLRKNDGVDKEQKRVTKNKERTWYDRFGFGFEAAFTRDGKRQRTRKSEPGMTALALALRLRLPGA